MFISFIIIIAAIFTTTLLGSIITNDSPTIIMDGFSWAENLVFDGKGNLFVSEPIYSYLYHIYSCNNGTEYCKDIYLRGFDRIGGLVITPDGETIFIGVAFRDGTNGIIYTTADVRRNLKGDYTLLVNTASQPNGLQLNWPQSRLYYTYEGKPDKASGLFVVDIDMKLESTAYSPLVGADGLWFDELYQYLYVGALLSKKITVFDVSNKDNIKFIQEFEGLHLSLNSLHFMDDFTLYNHTNKNNINETLIIGTDWTGRSIYIFSLDGKYHQKVPINNNNFTLFEPASVRWGKGKGFDMKSIYISESGGLTKLNTDRRIIQVKMNDFVF